MSLNRYQLKTLLLHQVRIQIQKNPKRRLLSMVHLPMEATVQVSKERAWKKQSNQQKKVPLAAMWY
jgi:hypothetical protein